VKELPRGYGYRYSTPECQVYQKWCEATSVNFVHLKTLVELAPGVTLEHYIEIKITAGM
jgi:hypothetical protein